MLDDYAINTTTINRKVFVLKYRMAFNRDSRSGGGRSFGGRRDFGGGDRGEDRQMFKAVCANCGKDCEVPFRPTGSKPVYCRDCFRTMGEGAGSSRSDDRGSRRPSYDSRGRSPAPQPQNRDQFEELNAKLDKILKLLNPEKKQSASKVVVEAPVENAEPVKKKAKVKKLAPVEVVEEAPLEVEIPLETPAE